MWLCKAKINFRNFFHLETIVVFLKFLFVSVSRFPFCVIPSCSVHSRAYLCLCEFLTSCFLPYSSHTAFSRLYLNHSLISLFLRKVFTPLCNPGKAPWRDSLATLNLQVLKLIRVQSLLQFTKSVFMNATISTQKSDCEGGQPL